MNFVKDNLEALARVKEYIDCNQEKAINSIFCETEYLVKIKDPTLKKIIELMILDVIRNENAKFSDITYKGGGFSRILLIGDKVIKLGNRATKSFPNNPYIVAPLLRKEFELGDEKCFTEVTERVDTSTLPSEEVLGLDTKRGTETLEEGDLVILDADFIYDENDPNIKHTNNKFLYDEFEERFQNEKNELRSL